MAARAASLALSLLAHAVLATVIFLLARPFIEAPPPRAPLAFELSSPIPAPAPAAAPAAVAPPALPRRPRRAPSPSPKPAPAPAPDSSEGSVSPPTSPSSQPASPLPSPAPALSPTPLPAAPTPATPPPLDASAIRSSVQSSLRYPSLARKRGLQGTVLLRFRILPDGSVVDLSVLGSASPTLDEAATAAVRRAAPFRSGPGWVRIPVVFDLDAPAAP